MAEENLTTPARDEFAPSPLLILPWVQLSFDVSMELYRRDYFASCCARNILLAILVWKHNREQNDHQSSMRCVEYDFSLAL